MAADERLGASFSIDITALKAGLQQANRLIKESNSEFKAAAAGLDDWTSSEEGLTAKLKNLNEVADLQAKKVDALQKEYDNCISNGLDPMSAAAVKMRTDINNEKAALEKTKSEINKYENSLNQLADASDEAGDEIEDLGDSAEKASDGFTIAKGAIADLISNGIQSLAGACKNAISSIAGLAEETRESRTEFAKLETSFETAGLGAAAAEKTMSDLYGILGDTGQATEASNLLAKMSKDQQDLDKNTRILTGVFAEYGSSIPTEGLAEAMASTSAMSSVQGVLADALEWQGINLDDYNEKLAAMSTEEERAAFIQDTLTDLYGDSADAYRENNKALIEANEAQLDYDKTLNKFGDMVEPLTTKVKDGFTKILDKVAELTEGVDFEAFGEKIDEAFDTFINDVLPKVIDGLKWIVDNKDILIAGLSGIAAGFAAFKVATLITSVVTAIQAAGGALAFLNTTMLASPITWIAVGVAALVAAIVLLIKNWDAVREAGAKAWEWIKGAWETAAEWFNEKVIQPIVDFFSGVWTSVSGFFKQLWEDVSGYFVNLWNDIVNAYHTVIDPWIEIIKRLAALINETVIQPVKEYFKQLWEDVSGFFSSLWNDIVAIWSVVSNWFNVNVVTPIKTVFSSAWTALKDGATKAWAGVKSVFSKVGTFFSDTFSAAWKKVKDVFSTGGKIFDGIKDGIVTAFKKVVNVIIGGINKAIAAPFNGLNIILDKIKNIDILGIEPFSWLTWRAPIPEMPLLAKGGVVRGATHAIIGEDGAEAVVPLEKNTEWIDKVAEKLSSKSGVVINQTNNYSQAHSRFEIYKSKQQTAAAVRLAMGV